MKIQKIIITIVWLAFLAGALFLALQRFDSFLKLKAMGDCGQSSHYQVKDKSGALVSYPVKEVYEKCLKEKGY